jgi:hypothetical protein
LLEDHTRKTYRSNGQSDVCTPKFYRVATIFGLMRLMYKNDAKFKIEKKDLKNWEKSITEAKVRVGL